ncbi:MAG: transketolase [Candidatus Hydrogenedentes bacterium]|nr:transketolase [Candidatus Hydrogenedentota bacterium]
MGFPIDVSRYQPLKLDPTQEHLTEAQKQRWLSNVQLLRDTIVFYTAIAGIKGLAGHTGGAFNIVPELLLADGFMRGSGSVYPVLFDEAGHRVAIQYAMAAFNGEMPFEKLLHYREYDSGLYGHPELDPHLGVRFSSGRLGHLWPFVNGVARAHPDQAVVIFGSDGSQQEGNDAEAARFAVARGLNIKVLVDDNDVTIAGHPSQYLSGFDLEKTLGGHGLRTDVGDGEDLDSLYTRVQRALAVNGPVALINKRKMAPGVPVIEGSPKGHDVISADAAIQYLEQRNQPDAVTYLKSVTKPKVSISLVGSSKEVSRNRDEFGKIICGLLDKMSPEERRQKVVVIDSDLEGSCGLHHIRKQFPEVYIPSGVMERGNFSAAAGFGFEKGRQGIFATFSAFLEMVVSEITMARLNKSNVLAHFSHAGVDGIADNTCHYGINIFFAGNGLASGDNTRLYFPADGHQFKAAIETVFNHPGLRFVFSTRSEVPYILKEDDTPFFDSKNGYQFVPGKDDIIREGTAGYVVSFGEMLSRCLDTVDRMRADGMDVGLVNKATLNVVDEATLAQVGGTPFVLVVETQNFNTGLGCRYGTWLLERGFAPRFAHMGTARAGNGGLHEHIGYQHLGPEHIKDKIQSLMEREVSMA